jgi:uncharacterized protein YqhQ
MDNKSNSYSKIIEKINNLQSDKIRQITTSISKPKINLEQVIDTPSIQTQPFDFIPNPLIEISQSQLNELNKLNQSMLDLKLRLDKLESENALLERKNKRFQWILGIVLTLLASLLTVFITYVIPLIF